MMSRKEAVAAYQLAGIEVWKAHQVDLDQFADQSGKLLMPSVDSKYAKLFHKEVKRSRSILDAIRPPMFGLSQATREAGTHPLVAVMGFQQALATLRLLAISKYGESAEIERVVAELNETMPQMLGLRTE
jgi:hypothetical protein